MIIKSIAARLANHPEIIDEQDGTAAKSSRNRGPAALVTACLSISRGGSQEYRAVMDAAGTGAPCQVGTHGHATIRHCHKLPKLCSTGDCGWLPAGENLVTLLQQSWSCCTETCTLWALLGCPQASWGYLWIIPWYILGLKRPMDLSHGTQIRKVGGVSWSGRSSKVHVRL